MREPFTQTDYAAHCDSPDDQLAELFAEALVPLQAIRQAIRAVYRALELGILERMKAAEYLAQPVTHELLRRVLSLIGDSPNAALRVWCLDFLAGTNLYGGKSEIAIARQWGCGRANVSRIVKELQAMLGTHVPIGGKAQSACESYAERARRNHAEGKIKKPFRPWAGAKITYYERTNH